MWGIVGDLHKNRSFASIFKKKTKTLKDIHIKLQTESNCFDKPLSAVMKFDHEHNRLKSSKSSVIFTGCRSAQLDGSRVDLQRG